MLFHVTMTHTPDNCPAQMPPDKQKEFFDHAQKLAEAAEGMGVKVHFMVSGAGHTMYALIEADSFDAINMFFTGFKFKQDYQIEPVGHVKDMIAAFQAQLAKR